MHAPPKPQIIAENTGDNGGWVGFIRTPEGIAALYLSFENDVDGCLVLASLDGRGNHLQDVLVESSDLAGRSPICVVPTGNNSALVVGVPADGRIGPDTSYDELLVSLDPHIATTAICSLPFDVIPEVSYAQLPGDATGVLAAGLTKLWWTVVRPDEPLVPLAWRRPSEGQVAHPHVWVDPDGRPWVVYSADYRQVQAVRYEGDAPVEQRTLTRRFGNKQEVTHPEIVNGASGPFLVYHRNNGRRKREKRELCLETAGWGEPPRRSTRLTDDREVTRWAVGQCTAGAILIWEAGISKRDRAVRSASLKSPTEISSPLSINVPFPDFVVPHEDHVVLLAHHGASLTTLAVDFES